MLRLQQRVREFCAQAGGFRPAASWRGAPRDLRVPPLGRRRLGLLVAGGMLPGMGRRAGAQPIPSVEQARHFIRVSGDRMLAVLNGPGAWPQKQVSLQRLVAETLDVAGISRFAMARFWNLASPAQRDEFVRLFPAVLLGHLGRTVGVFEGVSFSIDRAAPSADSIQVWTTVFRAADPPRHVSWLVTLVGDRLKVADIFAEGTSLRITEREDVISFLSRHQYSIEALLQTLRGEVAENGIGPVSGLILRDE